MPPARLAEAKIELNATRLLFKVAEYSMDGSRLFNAGDDPYLAATASALIEVELKHPLQNLRPARGLMTLDGQAMETPMGGRKIHFVLRSGDNRVTGFSGCNSMMGSYKLSGTQIEFSQMGGTMIARVNGMDLERQFHQLFPRVAAWNISGETLQLLDMGGAMLATFESRYLK